MSATLYRPAHWAMTDRDAVAAFERQRERDALAERRLTSLVAIGCLMAVALILGMVMR